MKIKKDILLGFLKSAAMTGVSSLDSCRLNFAKNGIIINSASAANGMFINALLKKDCIEDYKDIGEIAVQNLQDILKLLEGFNGNIQLLVDKNKIIFTSKNRKVKILLMDIDIVKKMGEFPNKHMDGMKIKIDISVLQDFMKNISIVDSAEFSITIKGNSLLFNTKGHNEVTERVEIEKKIEKEIILVFNRIFPDAITNLNGEILLMVKKSSPIGIISKSKEVEIKMLITQVVEGEK